MTNKALFLDRDGTINVDKAYVYKIEDFEFINGIFELCLAAQQKGYLIIIITNQSGIARGYYNETDYQVLTSYMLDKFKKQGIKITDVFYCPDLVSTNRKPNPGMFLQAQKKYNIDMLNSISLGDKERDVAAGQNAGVGKNFLFDGNYNKIKEAL